MKQFKSMLLFVIILLSGCASMPELSSYTKKCDQYEKTDTYLKCIEVMGSLYQTDLTNYQIRREAFAAAFQQRDMTNTTWQPVGRRPSTYNIQNMGYGNYIVRER